MSHLAPDVTADDVSALSTPAGNPHYNPLLLSEDAISRLEAAARDVDWYWTDPRDGRQGPWSNVSAEDQVAVGRLLLPYAQALGGTVEGGYAGATEDEQPKMEALDALGLTVSAFGSGKIRGKTLDEHFAAILAANTPAATIFVKSSRSQVETSLSLTPAEQYLETIRESVAYLKEHGKTAIIDMEHFFDGYLEDREFAMACIGAALDGGADRIVLCDTLGGTPPLHVHRIVTELGILGKLRGKLGIHLHDDHRNTVDSIISAMSTGNISHIQGNMAYGCGERVGNSSLALLWVRLLLDYGIDVFEGLPQHARLWGNLIRTYAKVKLLLSGEGIGRADGILNPGGACHTAGMHTNALGKNANTYRVIAEVVQRLLDIHDYTGLTGQAGAENVRPVLRDAGLLTGDDGEDRRIVAETVNLLKRPNALGYTDNRASFVLEAHNVAENTPESTMSLAERINHFFGIKRIRTGMDEDESGNSQAFATIETRGAQDKSGDTIHATGTENGIFHEFSEALRGLIAERYPCIRNLSLLSYTCDATRKGTTIDGSGADVLVRLIFQDKETSMLFSVVERSKNADKAGIDALKQAYYYFIQCKEGTVQHVEDPLLETTYGEISWK